MEQIEGEIIGITYPLAKDNLSQCKWRTKDGLVIPVCEMADSHLRNAALFLMGMGYTKCTAIEGTRITYLTILRMEWERRMSRDKRLWRVNA